MDYDVTITTTEKYTVKIDPLKVFDETFNNLRNVKFFFEKPAHLVIVDGVVKVEILVSEGYDYGHYYKDDDWRIRDLPENFPESTVNLFLSYTLLREWLVETGGTL
jgi:hypothetical protein